MRPNRAFERMIATTLVAATLTLIASAQDAQTNAPAAPDPASAKAGSKSAQTPGPKDQPAAPASKAQKQYSPGVADILKLLQAGVSKDVIKAFVEHSSVVYQLTADDIVALKQQGVPDDLITTMVQRGMPAAGQGGPVLPRPPNPGASPAQVSTPSEGIDPEGYEFWWYHYAYPRALASANERLFSSYAPFYGYSGYAYSPYGFYPALPFQPRSTFVLPRTRLAVRP
jgi:hypothetical protein